MDIEKIQATIEHCLRENPCTVEYRFNEPMSAHTSLKVGGPADCWIKPGIDAFPEFITALLTIVRKENISLFILGGGANILFSDNGIRGIVLDTTAWTGKIDSAEENTLTLRSGTALDMAAETAASNGMGGIEFLAGMPGSIGGALWMNARAYEREISDVLVEAGIIDLSTPDISFRTIQLNKDQFSYKRSPFQVQPWIILSAVFALHSGNKDEIQKEIEKYRNDREKKGHYLYPSAGSAFKNNPDYGLSTGKLIDELGLRGLQVGGAQIAPFHGNIVINTGNATAADVRNLLELTATKVEEATGFMLEPEILFARDW